LWANKFGNDVIGILTLIRYNVGVHSYAPLQISVPHLIRDSFDKAALGRGVGERQTQQEPGIQALLPLRAIFFSMA